MYIENSDREISTLAQLRADIPLTRECAYFQSGGRSPVPNSTRQSIAKALEEETLWGLIPGTATTVHDKAERARELLAALLQVSADELAWTQNTSHSMRLATNSLPWKQGDRLAITSAEHIGTMSLTRGVEQFTGNHATVIPVGDGKDYSPDVFLERLDRLLTSDHRLLIISHVTSMDGRRLPVVEATRIARDRGVKVLVDGAQSVGQLLVNVSEIDPEFFVGSLSKWLLGPAGAGYLYVARRQLPEYRPDFMPDPYPKNESHGGAEIRLSAANRTEIGSANRSLRAGAAHAIDTTLRIGLGEIERHNRELTDRLRNGLRRTSGIEPVTPSVWDLSSAITSVRLPGCSVAQVQELIKRLGHDYRVVVKHQWDFEGMRVSVASFNDEEDVERLLEGLEQLLRAIR